MVDVFGILQA